MCADRQHGGLHDQTDVTGLHGDTKGGVMQFLTMASEWLQTHSILLTEAIRQSLIVGMVFGVLQWNESQLGVVLSAVSAVLAIFTSKSNISKHNVDLMKDKA